MKHILRNLFRFGLVVALTLGVFAVAVQARDDDYRYCYVSLDDKVPQGYAFFLPSSIDNSGRVYGNALSADYSLASVAVYEKGKVTLIDPNGSVNTANQRGTIGGEFYGPVISQAALWRRGKVKLIPPLPGESFAYVTGLNDLDTAFVESYDNSFTLINRYLYKDGKVTPLNFGPDMAVRQYQTNRFINNQNIISGTKVAPGFAGPDRAFRFNPRTGKMALLNPLPTEPNSWGLGINDSGDVLGYSFVYGGLERIGVWDKNGKFHTYFVEGTPQYPTISNILLFNENNLIVITNTSDNTSYLVPRPGLRLDLATLVENLPTTAFPVQFIQDVNNRGDIVGTNNDSSYNANGFLLKRLEYGERCEKVK